MKIGRKRIAHSINQLMNDEGVCRTAPATPGLLITRVWSVMGVRNVKIGMAHCRVGRDMTVGRVRRVRRCRRVISRPPSGFPAPKSLITAL